MAKAKGGEVAVYDPKNFAVSTQVRDRFAGLMSRENAAKVGSTLWPFLGTRGAQFRLGENKLGTEFDGIVLGTVALNQFYEGSYDPDNTSPPKCFAIADLSGSDDPAGAIERMAPPKELATKVSESCKLCPMNAWGSQGRGKACKNGRRLIVLGYSETTDLRKTQGARLNVPVTSVSKLADYTKKLAEMGRPLIATVTRFSLSLLDKGGFAMDFEPVTPINDLKTLDVLEQRAKDGLESLIAPPSTEPQAEKPAAKGPAKRRMVKR